MVEMELLLDQAAVLQIITTHITQVVPAQLLAQLLMEMYLPYKLDIEAVTTTKEAQVLVVQVDQAVAQEVQQTSTPEELD
jgi:hypothetical protein